MTSRGLSDQKIVLRGGKVIRGKYIRLCSQEEFEVLGGSRPTKTIGYARVKGSEIPVKRTRGRSRWVQAGNGVGYSA